MKRCLDLFCQISGQQVNFAKSCVFVSKNVPRGFAHSLAGKYGSPLTDNLGKYLGVPVIHDRVSKYTYSKVVERVQDRLAAWKCNTLPMAGRITLVKAITASLPVYTMQSARLPSTICSKLDKLNRNFIWGHDESKARTHLVNWDSVCTPITRGGLGIRKMQPLNQALLAKAAWRIHNGDQGLWANMFREKYLRGDSIINHNHNSTSSTVWKGVCHGSKVLREGCMWNVGDGSKIDFWVDDWLGLGPLSQYAIRPLSAAELAQKVEVFLNDYGWNLDKLQSVLPMGIVHKIFTIYAGRKSTKTDRAVWKFNTNRNYSTKSGYFMLESDPSARTWEWSFIWHLNVPPRIKPFLWILAKGKLLTNLERTKRGMATSDLCPLRCGRCEDFNHIFHECSTAKKIWQTNQIATNSQHQSFYTWFRINIRGNQGITFCFNLWYLWKWRCKQVFEYDFVVSPIAIQIIS